MLLESFQMFSTVLRHYGVQDPLLYCRTHQHHPCTKWLIESRTNYLWLLEHVQGMHQEYKSRYRKVHRSYLQLIDIVCQIPLNYPEIGLTKFVLAMPDKYKVSDPIQSYRNYYIGDKLRFATWRLPSHVPDWIIKDYEEKTLKTNTTIHTSVGHV